MSSIASQKTDVIKHLRFIHFSLVSLSLGLCFFISKELSITTVAKTDLDILTQSIFDSEPQKIHDDLITYCKDTGVHLLFKVKDKEYISTLRNRCEIVNINHQTINRALNLISNKDLMTLKNVKETWEIFRESTILLSERLHPQSYRRQPAKLIEYNKKEKSGSQITSFRFSKSIHFHHPKPSLPLGQKGVFFSGEFSSYILEGPQAPTFEEFLQKYEPREYMRKHGPAEERGILYEKTADRLRTLYIFKESRSSLDKSNIERKILFEGATFTLPVSPLTKWIDKLQDSSGKIFTNESFETNFPELYQRTLFIEDLQLKKVHRILKRDTRPNNKIGFIGIEIDATSIQSWGPFLLIMVQVYFLLHSYSQEKTIRLCRYNTKFPWIGVYDPLAIRILFSMTYALLPFGTIIVIYTTFPSPAHIIFPILQATISFILGASTIPQYERKLYLRAITDIKKKLRIT